MSLLGKPYTIVGLTNCQLDAMERYSREMNLAAMCARQSEMDRQASCDRAAYKAKQEADLRASEGASEALKEYLRNK